MTLLFTEGFDTDSNPDIGPITTIGNVYVIAGFVSGGPFSANKVVFGHRVAANIIFPIDFGTTPENPVSTGGSFTAATSKTIFKIDKCLTTLDPTQSSSWVTIGTIIFEANGYVASFLSQGSLSYSAVIGDYIRWVAPAVPDATLNNMFISLAATRT